MDNFSDVSSVLADICTKTMLKSVVASYYYGLSHSRCILLLIIDIVIMCNNNIVGVYYLLTIDIVIMCNNDVIKYY